MFRNRLIQYYFISLLTLVVGFFFLTSCGSSSKNAETSGTIGILLKDTHTVTVEDPAAGSTLTLTQLWVTIDKVSLEGSEESWLSVYDSTAIDPATNQPVGPKV
ncbi:MAG: hypothetical protein HZA19_00870 [Nitrospirae bacterium]|nr:hypothetical protein [Nitrospirota bacterium]